MLVTIKHIKQHCYLSKDWVKWSFFNRYVAFFFFLESFFNTLYGLVIFQIWKILHGDAKSSQACCWSRDSCIWASLSGFYFVLSVIGQISLVFLNFSLSIIVWLLLLFSVNFNFSLFLVLSRYFPQIVFST